MAPQHILSLKGWKDYLVVGWDPAMNTYYAQVRTAKEPLDSSRDSIPLWLTPRPREIPTVDALEKVLNKSIDGRWPVVSLPRDVRENLEYDKRGKARCRPPAPLEYYDYEPDRDDDEEEPSKAHDIKDWFLENYEERRKGLFAEASVPDKVLKHYFGDIFPRNLLEIAHRLIQEEGISKWTPTSWRYE